MHASSGHRRTVLSAARAAISAPFWFLQLFSGAKSFRDNPFIGSKRLNRLGLHGVRVRAAHALARSRRARLARHVDPADRAQFEEQGFVAIADFLPADLFARMRQSLLERHFPAREMLQGDTITRRMAVDPEMLRAVPGLAEALATPRLQALLRYVASDAGAPLFYIQSILSHVVDAPPDPQEALHADTFHPTMKAWLFLTDVAEDEGPFTYVPGSHRLTPERLAWEEAHALQAPEGVDHLSARGSMRVRVGELPGLGLPAPRHLAVRANTLVVADTCGFHARGPSVRPTTRVELWAYSRRNPYLPWTGLSLLSLPGIAERRVGALWAVRDRLEEWVGQPWKSAGLKRPADR
jgi:hypothetical protein